MHWWQYHDHDHDDGIHHYIMIMIGPGIQFHCLSSDDGLSLMLRRARGARLSGRTKGRPETGHIKPFQVRAFPSGLRRVLAGPQERPRPSPARQPGRTPGPLAGPAALRRSQAGPGRPGRPGRFVFLIAVDNVLSAVRPQWWSSTRVRPSISGSCAARRLMATKVRFPVNLKYVD